MDIKVQNQLNRLLSPEFDVTIAEAGDLINILNVIKAKCASSPEKFRLLVGLLCQVDLSITNIEEHYEQLLIKNRIFHLLRMFPDVVHPLLDLIARATNQCCPLASLPVTIGHLEEERFFNKTKNSKSSNTAQLPIPHIQQLNHSTCLRKATQHVGVVPPMVTTGTQQAGISTPQRLSVVTPVVAQTLFSQTISPTAHTTRPMSGSRHPAEFDISRKLYDQAPLSFRQSSQFSGGLHSSGEAKSPTEIQKRILLQQQRHLRQQLEILQARRQQQMVCSKNVTFALPKMVTSNMMESSVPTCSTVIGPSCSLAEPVRITRSCSGRLVSQQQNQGVAGVQQNTRDIKPLDLRSPRRRKATEEATFSGAKKASLNKHPECIPANFGSCEVPITSDRRDNADKEKDRGLLLNQVGQHCIMVSAIREDRSGSESQDSDTYGASKKTEPTKTRAKQRPRKRKASGCKGPVIKVQDLCHMARTSPKSQVKVSSAQELETTNGNPSLNTALEPEQGDKYQGPHYHNSNNNNNNNNKGITQDFTSTQSKTQRSSKRYKPVKAASKSKTKKQQIDLERSGLAEEILVPKPQPVVSADVKTSQDALSAQATKNTATGSPNVSTAVFDPVNGGWSRAPATASKNDQTYPHFQCSQSSDCNSDGDIDSAYLLCGGCDDDAWYQSSQFDEMNILSSSVTEMQSFTGPESFYKRLVESTYQGDTAQINSTTSEPAAPLDTKRKPSPTETSKVKQGKKKH